MSLQTSHHPRFWPDTLQYLFVLRLISLLERVLDSQNLTPTISVALTNPPTRSSLAKPRSLPEKHFDYSVEREFGEVVVRLWVRYFGAIECPN